MDAHARHCPREDLRRCRQLLRRGSRTFYAASLLLPRQVREPASALYAFCRVADDAVDLDAGREHSVERLRARLDRAYHQSPRQSPVDRAFVAMVARHALPRALPEALLEGFAWDLEGRRYDDLGQLRAYGARVAGSVGAMMAVIMGARDPAVVSRACDLGVAMQLTNIARDVGEDARAGRLYLPLAWMREAGLDPQAWLAAPVFDNRLASVIRRLLAAADELYDRADAGIDQLPRGCRPAIHAARRLYAYIGRTVESNGCDSVSRRAVVPAHQKISLLACALGDALAPAPWQPIDPLPETAYLVDAVAQAPAPPPPLPVADAPGEPDLDERVARLVALFGRLEMLEHRPQPQRAQAGP